MLTPKVSVLMPIYKTKEEDLKTAIESILNQTFKDFEFIILNDSPELNYLDDIVNSYNDTRIKYFKNDKNIGISPSRNKLLELAKGEYIAIFDHDDISLPERLEKEVRYLDEHPNIGVVSSNIERFPEKVISQHPSENIDIKKTLMYSNVVAHTAMMIRRQMLIKTGVCYEEKYSPAEDYMLCLKLIEFTEFHNLKEVLVKYRFEDFNTTNRMWASMVDADALCRNYALRHYPYLASFIPKIPKNKKMWILLLGFMPIIKVKINNNKTRFLLFGFFPIFTIKEKV